MVYATIYKVLNIPGGCLGFLNHQPYLFLENHEHFNSMTFSGGNRPFFGGTFIHHFDISCEITNWMVDGGSSVEKLVPQTWDLLFSGPPWRDRAFSENYCNMTTGWKTPSDFSREEIDRLIQKSWDFPAIVMLVNSGRVLSP